jgi:hypothetical protein
MTRAGHRARRSSIVPVTGKDACMTTPDLDQWMAQLAAAPADHALDGMEAEIGRAIGARRLETRAVKALGPARLAAVGVALAIGVASGAVSALSALPASSAHGPFASVAQLAPSTLLDDAG